MAEPSPYPDLLHPEAACRIDEERTRLALGLAFTSGVSGGLFAEALADVRLAPSAFHPDGFEDDLFVPTFVANAFSITVDGTRAVLSTKLLTRLVTHPPSDPRAAAQRREILRELSERPELREAATSLYVRLCRLRGLVEGATGTGKLDPTRRQLDILTLLREIVEGAATGFATATSALSRIAAFGARVREGEPFRSMVDLLSYDENMATLTLAVGIGADGRIRALAIRDVATNPENPFTSSPLRRFLAKLELFVRGYSFSDGEVMARLVDAVYSGIDDELPKLVQLMGDFELLLGAMGFRDAATAAGLDTCLPEVASPDEPREMEQLWNPFLLTASTASGAAPRVVPCDLVVDRHTRTVLVTGPNSGGKTRLLQSIGISQLLAQCGLFVPARRARIAPVSGLVVSLIQETRADQSEGRLGTELLRIRTLFENLSPGSMVILDELCSGTNPSEGEEIFELVLRMLEGLSPHAFITTHFLAFASRLEAAGDISALRFLQVELGPTQAPTYQFRPGVARTSLAGRAAERLGVTRTQLEALVSRSLGRTAEPER